MNDDMYSSTPTRWGVYYEEAGDGSLFTLDSVHSSRGRAKVRLNELRREDKGKLYIGYAIQERTSDSVFPSQIMAGTIFPNELVGPMEDDDE